MLHLGSPCAASFSWAFVVSLRGVLSRTLSAGQVSPPPVLSQQVQLHQGAKTHTQNGAADTQLPLPAAGWGFGA